MRRTKDAFIWIINILKELSVPFQIAGGFAARIYGSHRRLADIDIGVPDNDVGRIFPKVKKYIVYGPKHYIDRNDDLLLMTLRYRDQMIDIYGNDNTKLYDLKNRKWVPYRLNLKKGTVKNVYGINVPIISKKKLIEYKKLLMRKVDIEDIRRLEKSVNKVSKNS